MAATRIPSRRRHRLQRMSNAQLVTATRVGFWTPADAQWPAETRLELEQLTDFITGKVRRTLPSVRHTSNIRQTKNLELASRGLDQHAETPNMHMQPVFKTRQYNTLSGYLIATQIQLRLLLRIRDGARVIHSK
ncbi:hypothetical protein ASPBRDRAFT_569909 [Aspergillus brasiliensis CBS 101740]|uniref:Uncharacterized protein n=1 Tax=Aspergillus brasiliensis (strain CBS 101740 / IMI 381727 / IBT 21946) TaxID=767769 RepID=A0A1L9UIQ9_ASPBC|nr:hypothetical protein ASPBRDRAFT_569909 [Aspergillus brasiliensis CBS 101740]